MSNKATSKKFAKLAAYLLPGLKISALLCLTSFAGVRLHAQALPPPPVPESCRLAANSTTPTLTTFRKRSKGGGAYVGFDFKYHWGIEAEFHQINDSDPTTKIYERTYEIGPRSSCTSTESNPSRRACTAAASSIIRRSPASPPVPHHKAPPQTSPTTSEPPA
ncbi:hypothetical protein [Tunturiibacter lichenicola]|uniref:hypothetical protein n=1 Tax=Tunturiibacter lichenicola TaxID=2051959 RepID=UPI003D9B09C4